jgi:hypothetical protein
MPADNEVSVAQQMVSVIEGSNDDLNVHIRQLTSTLKRTQNELLLVIAEKEDTTVGSMNAASRISPTNHIPRPVRRI